MRVVRVQPGQMAEVIDIENSLDALQKEVGGYIQMIYPFKDTVGIVCNEEGKLMGLPANKVLLRADGSAYDVLVGTFLMVNLSDDDLMDFTEAQAKYWANLINRSGYLTTDK